VKGVKTKMMMNQQVNNKRCTNANGKAYYVDKRKGFVPPNIPESND
jgi:hypothetical protein